jgi:hypothetical protein
VVLHWEVGIRFWPRKRQEMRGGLPLRPGFLVFAKKRIFDAINVVGKNKTQYLLT